MSEVRDKMLHADLNRAVEQFHENIGTAGETCRPTVAANDTTIMIYQRHHRDGGIDVIGIPRGGLREFIALLVEVDRDADRLTGGSLQIVAVGRS